MNYGNPAELHKVPHMYGILRKMLGKPSFRHDKKYRNFTKYSESVAVRILEDDFYRYGWELSHTDTVTFNRLLESGIKAMVYVIVGTQVSMGVALSDAIDYFQLKFGFDENIWKKESIYKDCQRNLKIEKNSILKNLSDSIDKIYLDKLSRNKTISLNAKNRYENGSI
jgi:hypothetical protein